MPPDTPLLAAPEASVLARFSLLGHDCVVVADAASSAGERLGALTVDGRRCTVYGVPRTTNGADPLERLTPRELEIAALVTGGCCSKSIARRLGISAHTVGAHIGRIFAKLDVHKRTELAARIAQRMSDCL